MRKKKDEGAKKENARARSNGKKAGKRWDEEFEVRRTYTPDREREFAAIYYMMTGRWPGKDDSGKD